MNNHGWTHDGLMNDLASYLRGPDLMLWEDMQLGPSGSPRPDVYTIRKSYSKPHPAAFECKVSRSDLRSDTTSGKWQSYLKFAGSVTFAVPDGLCTVADIPDGCGLIIRKAQAWRYARRPTIQKVTLPMDACMKLLIDGVNRTSRERQSQPRSISAWEGAASVRQKYGKAVALAATDLLAAQAAAQSAKDIRAEEYARVRNQVENYKEQQMVLARAQMAEFEQHKRAICEWLGLDPDRASTFSVRHAIDRLRKQCDADQRVQKAEADLSNARRAVESALNCIKPETPAWAA